MEILYRQMDHLPHPPADLINDLIDQWVAKYNGFIKTSNFPDLTLTVNTDKLISTYDPIQHEIGTWLVNNVFSSDRDFSKWILRAYHRHATDGIVYEKHLDSKTKRDDLEQNNYVLIYNLTDSRGDLVYHREPGKPLVRNDRPVYIPPTTGVNQAPHAKIEFPGAFEVMRRSPPPKTWYLTRIDAIHSVENGNDVPRVALQLRLSEREAKALLAGEQLNYRRLKLPTNPLKVDIPLEQFKTYGDQLTRKPSEILSDEVLDIFKQAGLEPAVCFLFCQMNNQSSPDNRVIHYDLTRADPKPWHPSDDPALKTWKPVICGVNWEVNGSVTEFSWWDMTGVTEAWPVRKDLPIRFDELNSVHYVKRGNYGVPAGASMIDSALIDERPVLLRTGIPHQATYNGQNIRLGISVRFKETWTTWEEALEAFSALYD